MESGARKETRRRSWSALVARFAFISFIAAIGGERAALADSRAPALPLDFKAPATCIDGETFRARLSALPASPEKSEPPRAVHVRVVETEGTFRGELRV